MCIIRSILVLIGSFLLTSELLAGSDTSTQTPDSRPSTHTDATDAPAEPVVPMVTHESVMVASISEAVQMNGANGLGTVEQVSGDLAYITGLNGSAPLWSRLTIRNGHAEAVRLEVVKELNEILVARVLEANGTPIKPGDPVALDGSASIRTGRKARRVIHACQVEKGPSLDGRLDDDVWSRATPIEGFVQRDPNYWMPGSERTVARILYDHNTIYFGFECFQSSAVVANNMRRDSEISGDDNIQILLDTYNDRRNGFFFFVNSLGAQQDLMLSNEGRTYNRDWDCNWVAKSQRYSDRWTVEVAIPFSQLRFKESDEMIWGVNLARFIAGKNEVMQLVVGQQSSSSTERYRTVDIGELRGLERIRSKRPVQVKPYLLPGTTKDFQAAAPAENRTMETGVDLRYGMTSNISLDLSYNTDFAQVEGDQEQTNLTQFKLFFPEKREFFLEGSNLFSFGEQARRTGSGTRPPTLLFYSRRIGLEEGNKIPIIVGSKIAGKEGRTSVGVLNVLTDAGTFIDDEDTIQVHRTNYSVLRIRRDLFSRSNVGFIMVNKQVDDPNGGWNQYNRAGGIDFSYSPTDKLNFQGFVARTWDSNSNDADDARWAYVNYRGNRYWARLRYLDVEDQFEPAVGFVNRRSGLEGFRRYDTYFRIRPRPKFGNIRYMSIGPEFEVVTDRNNDVKYWKAELSWWTIFNTGDYWQNQLERTYDVVEESFSPSSRHSEIEIPAGTYKFTTFTTGPRPSRSRKFRPGITFEAGTYYTGKRYTIRSESAILPSGRFGLQLRYSVNWLRLPQGNLSIHTLSSRLLYSFSTDFFAKLFAQWNNGKEFVSANLLINYRYRPGSDIFIVFDNAYDTETGFERQNRSVLLKFSYLLNL